MIDKILPLEAHFLQTFFPSRILERMIEEYLTAHDLIDVPLLLGLSGGPDSTALFYLLKELNHPFQVAHVDHGWRSESCEEAAVIRQLCHKYEIPCHIHVLQLEGSNLEDLSRNARFTFFEEICKKERLKGVILGHHADDQAETVLKRVFEGASLPKLRGLAPVSQIGELTLFRPLLKVRKKKVIAWLEEREISFFQDPTNRDSRFLRSRMRTSLLPSLSEQFGKQVEPSLCRLGEAAAELADFLDLYLKPLREHVVHDEDRVSLDFSDLPEQPAFICKAAIRDLFEGERLAVPASVLVTILFHIQNNHVHKRLQVGQKEVEIHRRKLTIRKLKLIRL